MTTNDAPRDWHERIDAFFMRLLPRSKREDMYYWINRAIFPTWWERAIDWITGRSR